jgi:hypothetical protein
MRFVSAPREFKEVQGAQQFYGEPGFSKIGPFLQSALVGVKTIAEFVEHDDIRDALSVIGVDMAQGYLIHPSRAACGTAPLSATIRVKEAADLGEEPSHGKVHLSLSSILTRLRHQCLHATPKGYVRERTVFRGYDAVC